ncbi:crossover junction endonuclease MUS81-like isoform X2 [Tasmannia lanceolata]|uniref:crossover junction endonuclease MUS81-like isoform X2 n=1 Tax=Tasmannia lanceolata TaxID=3420 RepID=UPI0040646EB9
MDNQRPVQCPENEDLASFIWKKRQEMADKNGISDQVDSTIYRAYSNVCSSKNPIKTLKELSQVKGVGKWTLRLMQGFFPKDPDTTTSEVPMQKGKGKKGSKRYVPQKNSVSYALLITLYRGTSNEASFMRKQELIDAAEASGLARVPIAPEKGKGIPGQFMSSGREWYSGWSCMKTLVAKGLILKSSCPAKYMLTQEGQEVARESLLRSGLVDSVDHLTTQDTSPSCVVPRNASKPIATPTDIVERFTGMGHFEEQIHLPFVKVFEGSQNKESCSVSFDISAHLQKDPADSSQSNTMQFHGHRSGISNSFTPIDIEEDDMAELTSGGSQRGLYLPCSAESTLGSCRLRACTSSDFPVRKSLGADRPEGVINCLAMPPRGPGEKFEDAYDVILILDDREQFAKNSRGSRSRKVIDSICTQFKIEVEVRRLPVGDGIWIARHKHLDREYVLDFIVERKQIDDFCDSIKDNRYRDQKLRLLRCGLQKLIYLVEGDPNACEAAERIKTACFTTEILEGFDVQRTNGLTDTLRKYGHLTQAISHYYITQFSNDTYKSSGTCLSFDEFIRKCQDLDKMTISDLFAAQIMQVPQVTEEVTFAVLDLYPTLISLARAYSILVIFGLRRRC